ncbi:hypothetical protein KIPB_015162, partial [Kipferlia bialata]
ALDKKRQRVSEKMQAVLMEQLDTVRERLDSEILARQESEEHIIGTMDDVVANLQTGLSMITKK